MRLLSFLQGQGLSRRHITDMIDQGSIFLNGEKVNSYKADVLSGDEIKWENNSKKFQETDQNESHFLMLNKPIGYVCSKNDPYNTTIYELLPAIYRNWYYIGRLDKDSSGLVLLTDDSKMVNYYEHPRHGITKEYILTLNKPFRKEDSTVCLEGIEDDGEILRCVSCKYLPNPPFPAKDGVNIKEENMITIVLNEGKKRHIRRMMHALHYHVISLQRVREGEFLLGDLKEGEWKEITPPTLGI